MIFFISHSVVALRPAISMVDTATNRRMVLNIGNLVRNWKKRMVRNTPAVTRVEEWTSADTGVGAAIAAGNHLENGICALFVIAAVIIVRIWSECNESVGHMCRMFQCA